MQADQLDGVIGFYTSLLAGEVTLRFAYPDAGLDLAAVSSPHLSVLIVAGAADKRAPFEATSLTIRVDAIEPYIAILVAGGAEQLEPIQQTPVGRKTRFRHADGLTVEYVETDAASAR